MNDLLIAYLGVSVDEPVAWAMVRDGRVVAADLTHSIDELGALAGEMADDVDVAAVIPGEHVALRFMPTPPKARQKFLSAAMMLLEDDLAEPVESLHVAVGRHNERGEIVAVKKSIVQDILAEFENAGLTLRFLTTDLSAVQPDAEADATVLVLGDRLVAAGDDWAFAGESALITPAVTAKLPPSAHVRLHASEESAEPVSSVVHRVGASVDRHEPVQFSALVEHLAAKISGGAPNILQGDFKPKRRRSINLSPYKRPAAIAATFILAVCAMTVAEAFRAQSIAARYNDAAKMVHQQAFPSTPASQMRRNARALMASGGSASFVDITQKIDGSLGDDGEVIIDRLRFDGARGTYSFSIRATSNEAIDRFRERLAEKGVSANDVSGYRRSGSYWIGELSAGLR